jgi:hypothetical protein
MLTGGIFTSGTLIDSLQAKLSRYEKPMGDIPAVTKLTPHISLLPLTLTLE